ncbi:MAG: hypothetical protein WAT23_14620 [Chromatiaceae bacterium]
MRAVHLGWATSEADLAEAETLGSGDQVKNTGFSVETAAPILPWRDAKLAPEGTREVTGITVADPIRDEPHLQVGIVQQTVPALQTQRLQLPVGAHTDLFAKNAVLCSNCT